MSTKRVLPKWCPKSDQLLSANKLFLYNSLTRSKTEVMVEREGLLRWYNCGPTVYDSAHMGHARSYITFDIIRRVLTHYFNFNIFFVQNVTDIDDKIIQRARQRYLFQEYVSQERDGTVMRADIADALNYMETKVNAETDVDKKAMLNKLMATARQAFQSLDDQNTTQLLSQTNDILSQWLDNKNGQNVNDNKIFESLARYYEKEFNEDMEALNVLPADSVTRVSEFIPEIIEYIEVIIRNGFAYQSNGSVYFDTNRFDSSEKHFYAKLVPEAFGDNKALAEGEGDLSHTSDKRNVNDFALWKNSKPGEPFWASPWGKGRPGWHIECSVMASTMIGQQMDIHSGGYDLKFPHHDNEMAQAEAYYDTGSPWVHYFLHSGHLTISGCKMSKSLKNFITIKEALKRNTCRQLRFAFLLHSWKETLDYSDNTMNDAIHYEKFANEFFLTVKDLIRSNDRPSDKWTQKEINLNTKLNESVAAVDRALCDNIDTRSACEHIRRLITTSNLYLQECSQSPNVTLIKKISIYITKIFDTFGVISNEQTIGFSTESAHNTSSRETIVMPFLEIIAEFREKVRTNAIESKDTNLLIICDQIRDEILPNVGVRLEDYEVGDGLTRTRLKLVDKEILLKEKEEKLKALECKRLEKEKKLSEKLIADKKREEENKLCPKDLFTTQTDKYSAFDGKGLPTHDLEGKELSKSQLKKLIKLYSNQQKRHNECLNCKTD